MLQLFLLFSDIKRAQHGQDLPHHGVKGRAVGVGTQYLPLCWHRSFMCEERDSSRGGGFQQDIFLTAAKPLQRTLCCTPCFMTIMLGKKKTKQQLLLVEGGGGGNATKGYSPHLAASRWRRWQQSHHVANKKQNGAQPPRSACTL